MSSVPQPGDLSSVLSLPQDGSFSSQIIAFINPKSGERASAHFIHEELSRMFPGRVCDLTICFNDHSVAHKLIGDHAAGGTIIVAGGDGTVSFVMDLVEEISWSSPDQIPHIALIPMGTGNDLSRALGFGPGFSKEKICGSSCSSCCVYNSAEADGLVKDILAAPKGKLDRWCITVTDESGNTVFSRPMNNYFSIGFDARVAGNFDRFRNEHPDLCKRRLLNKLWFCCFGVGALCGEPKIRKHVTMKIDGTVQSIGEDLKCVVVSNLCSYGAGTQLWKDSEHKFLPLRFDDGILEIQGVNGALHMGCIQTSVRSSEKIAQGSAVEFQVTAPLAMQWDGEPLNAPEKCRVKITHHSTAKVLARPAS